MDGCKTVYNITANELHTEIVRTLREFGRHMDYDIDSILDKHDQHPLEQTITSVMMKVEVVSRNQAYKDWCVTKPNEAVQPMSKDNEKSKRRRVMNFCKGLYPAWSWSMN
jgi:hypothetical protein